MAEHVLSITADTAADLPAITGERFAYVDSPQAIASDNYLRSTLVTRAVQAFAGDSGLTAEDLGTVLGDLLCDLHHLADCLGLDWSALSAKGETMYQDEIEGVL